MRRMPRPAVLLVLLVGVVGCSAGDSLPPAVEAFKTAYESGDLETVKDLFTDDGIMTTTDSANARARPARLSGNCRASAIGTATPRAARVTMGRTVAKVNSIR